MGISVVSHVYNPHHSVLIKRYATIDPETRGGGSGARGPQSLTRKYDSNFLGLSECSAGILVEFSALLHCFKQFMPYLSLTALFVVNKFCPESTELPFHGHILYYHNGRMACVFDINVPSQTWRIRT